MCRFKDTGSFVRKGQNPAKNTAKLAKKAGDTNKTPKPTKDMLNLNYVAPPPMMSTSTVEMGHTDTQKPLLR